MPYTHEQYLKDYEHVPDGLEHFLEAWEQGAMTRYLEKHPKMKPFYESA